MIPSRTPGKTHQQIEPFDCDKHCRDMRGSGEFRDADRSARGCTRVDLPRVEGEVVPSRIQVGYMGRQPIPGVHEEDGVRVRNPAMPLERVSDGCPGGWYRCRFVWSLQPYFRARLEGGHLVDNPMLNRCEDEFVLWCVRVFENEQTRQANHRVEMMEAAT